MTIGSNILFYESIESTNITALALLREKELPEGTVIQAAFQSSGKGQAGNSWKSEKGQNLLFSVVLYPGSVSPGEQFIISMAISLGICDFTDIYFNGTTIKWPNDIYVNNEKIAGILIENSIMGDSIESSVAGIGFNINQDKFDPETRNPTSLKTITGRIHDTGKCLKEILACLDKRYKQLLYGDREQIRDEYISHLYRAGEWYTYRTAGIRFEGKITDILPSGSIRIEARDGNLREFSFKEVDFII
jgi:BirA family biotin operon repressor/biotin-[acetyl-CoA-carboxylase] ligase